MGTSLSGLTPATTFDGLLKTSDNEPLDGTLKTISDGSGVDSVLQLSNSALQVNGQFNVDTDTETTTINLRGNSLAINQVYSANEVTYNSIQMVNTSGIRLKNGTNTALLVREDNVGIGVGSNTPAARLHIKGSGATSATTSLLVQNSAGTELFKMRDDGAGFFSTYLQGTRIYTTALGESFPSLSFSGSSGTGIFQPSAGANVIGFSVSGSEKARIDANGVGIGETTPTARLHIKGSGNSSADYALKVLNSDNTTLFDIRDDSVVRIAPNSTNAVSFRNAKMQDGNAVFGTTTIPANTRFTIKGSGATSGSTALLVENSAGTDLIKVTDDGVLTTKQINTSNSGIIAGSGIYYGRSFTATNIFQFGADSVFAATITPTTLGTSGDKYIFSATLPYAPTSGSETLSIINASPTINQTGGANGITRGLYVNPTLTSAADFRAIETTAGNVVFGNLPTSATGLPTGAIWNDGGTLKIA